MQNNSLFLFIYILCTDTEKIIGEKCLTDMITRNSKLVLENMSVSAYTEALFFFNQLLKTSPYEVSKNYNLEKGIPQKKDKQLKVQKKKNEYLLSDF